MKKINLFIGAVTATVAAHAAVVEEVVVRQQWPWSTDVKVEYKLADVTSPVDLKVRVFDGETEIAADKVAKALKGDVYGISEGGVGSFFIDPLVACGADRDAVPDFKVRVETVASADNINEVLYKIVSLVDGSVTNVRRADFYNGRYGAYEESFAYVGETSLSDVFIWTSVTNDVKYKTTHMVFRKIPVAGQEILVGKTSGQYRVKLSHDYWMAVFEATQDQFNRLYSNHGEWGHHNGVSNPDFAATRPAETIAWRFVRGTTKGFQWGKDVELATAREVDSGTAVDKFRQITGNGLIDIPTAAQWEIACRAGTTAALYSGKACPAEYNCSKNADLAVLARYGFNGGLTTADWQTKIAEKGYAYYTAEQIAAFDLSRGTMPVGSYLPNAYGLYDMLGNVGELVLDVATVSYTAGELYVDPMGGAAVTAPTTRSIYFCGGSWGSQAFGNETTAFAKKKVGHDWTNDPTMGVRFCINEE